MLPDTSLAEDDIPNGAEFCHRARNPASRKNLALFTGIFVLQTRLFIESVWIVRSRGPLPTTTNGKEQVALIEHVKENLWRTLDRL